MLVRGNPPRWVITLIARVVELEGISEPTVFEWRRSSEKRYTTGRTWTHGEKAGKIVVTAGSERMQWTPTILHELAHWATGEGHTARFWDTLAGYARRHSTVSLVAACHGIGFLRARRRTKEGTEKGAA